jgi:hypothetical protein
MITISGFKTHAAAAGNIFLLGRGLEIMKYTLDREIIIHAKTSCLHSLGNNWADLTVQNPVN